MKTKRMSKKRAGRRVLCFALLATCLALPATAQQYPAKPVRIMVGFAPGGGVDTAARIVASGLADLWGSTVFVENRPGAAGSVATEFTAKAPPDGHTLMLCQIASHAITPARVRKLPYDHIADFAFPSMIGSVTNVFMVHPSVPMKTLGQYIAYARKHPGKLSFGSSGVGASPHLSIELLKTMARIDIVHVPYKGAALALSDVMSGHIESSVGNLSGSLLGAVRAGRVRALGVTAGKRSKHVPEVPTFAESGVPGFDVAPWYGICTQAKVPQPILAKLNADLNRILNDPAVRKRLEDQAVDVAPSTPEQFVAHVRAETAKWNKVVRDGGLEER
ncbi:MAG TPA: tripartite tricarboxylate transporter substrate binding protein [Burkholderiales bacterium]|nr:tripartite tricarboxylate transporter substrate binding protein [Burkholderiales bacterium]